MGIIKKICIVVVFTFMLLILGTINVKAAIWIANDEATYRMCNDNEASFKVSYTNSDRKCVLDYKLSDNVHIGGNSGQQYKGNPTITIKNITNGNVYQTHGMTVGDTIQVRYTIYNNNYTENDALTPRIKYLDRKTLRFDENYGKRVEKKRVVGNHCLLCFQDIEFTKQVKGDLDIKIDVPLVAGHDGWFTKADNNTYKMTIHIKIPDGVKSIKDVEKIKKNKKEEAKENSYGSYIKDSNTAKMKAEGDTLQVFKHQFSGKTKKEMVINFIKSYGIKVSSAKSDKIRFTTDSKDKEIQKTDTLKFSFTPTKKTTVYNAEQSGVNSNGTKAFSWGEKILKKGKKYYAEFKFIYYKDTIRYMVHYTPYELKDNASGMLEEADEQASSNAANREKEIDTELKLFIASIPDDTRVDNVNFEDVLDKASTYNAGNIDGSSASAIEKTTSKVLGVISNIGIVASVLILAVLGLKYIIGSVEEKAEYKKDMIPYLIGAILLFSITTVVKIMQTLGNSINKV